MFRQWLGSASILIAVVTMTTVHGQAHIRCQNTLGGVCGDSSRPREMNCCDYGYCQPWNSGYYQCIATPPQCPTQETDIDFFGNDLKTVYGLLPSQCCDECTRTEKCQAYTFVNENPDGKTACYLKTSAAGRKERKGAVSAVVQPIEPPARCPVQEIGYDYYGNDLKKIASLNQTQCCDACHQADGCVAYTWIRQEQWGDSSCFLKTSTAGRREKVGAISGKRPDVPLPVNCPVQDKDTDYYGNDLRNVRDVSVTQCCDECAKTSGCVGYTYAERDWDGRATCYLKSSTQGKVTKAGLVSGQLKCPTSINGPCGSSTTGALCCPEGSYCQPWNPWYYQCIALPNKAHCPVVETGVDYYGGDLEVKYGLLVDSCCDACYANAQCRSFTFINYNPDGKSACYLKKTLGERRTRVDAVSGTKV